MNDIFSISVIFVKNIFFTLSYLLARKLLTGETFADIVKSLIAFLVNVISVIRFY